MAVKNTHFLSIGEAHKIGYGWMDEYVTLVKGRISYTCACGHPIYVNFRKPYNVKEPYKFVIEHRNRTRRYSSKDPSEVAIFDRMVMVSSYVDCDFPKK